MQDKQNTPSKEKAPYNPEVGEKTSLGGAFNTGVTSEDPEEKEKIEKQGTMAVLDPNKTNAQKAGNDLTKEDIPDSTNESTGKMGSGQRQDTN